MATGAGPGAGRDAVRAASSGADGGNTGSGAGAETLRGDSGRAVVLHRGDKELFGAGGPTKRELARHYQRVAPVMLPHLRDRPIALQPYPDGINAAGQGYYVKRRPAYAPAWLGSAQVPRGHGGSMTMVVCDSAAALLWLADQAVVTVHSWLARASAPRRPDRLILDLDPSVDDFAAVRDAAHATREVLQELGLAAYLMTTGSRGLHVVSPIRPEIDSVHARALGRILAEVVVARHPRALTTRLRKDRRRDRVFIDYLRNGYGQLAVAPYSVRALPDAPVATPMRWDELDGIGSAREWTVRAPRLDACPFADLARHARSPLKAVDRLDRFH